MTAHADVHIMLVSEQAAPNLLAALDPAMKPKEAVLLISQKMNHRADALQQVLQEAGIKVDRVAVTDEHDPVGLENLLLEVAARRDQQSIALNVTGGNKLMALAAQTVAQAADWLVFYVDVDTDQIIWLNKQRPAQALSQQMRLSHYLRGYGYTLTHGIERPQLHKNWQDLLQDLVLNVGTLEEPIGQLNYLSQLARETMRVKLSARQLDSLSLHAVLRKFDLAGVLQLKNDTLEFKDEIARKFVSGGWIEYHVFQTVSQVTSDLTIRDKAANLQVKDASGQTNEIDVAFMARNRLFVIECKTARMDNPDDLKANDTLYKLAENCRRIGGLGTRGMLASYRLLRDPEMRLARALNIEVIAGRDLARLGERLKQWVNPKA